MKERFFKVDETVYSAVKVMDDKRAGKFFKSLCEYAFGGKVYGGKDVMIKSNFELVKHILDGHEMNRQNGKLGAIKSAEKSKRKRDEDEALKRLAVSRCVLDGMDDFLSKMGG